MERRLFTRVCALTHVRVGVSPLSLSPSLVWAKPFGCDDQKPLETAGLRSPGTRPLHTASSAIAALWFPSRGPDYSMFFDAVSGRVLVSANGFRKCRSDYKVM